MIVSLQLQEGEHVEAVLELTVKSTWNLYKLCC